MLQELKINRSLDSKGTSQSTDKEAVLELSPMHFELQMANTNEYTNAAGYGYHGTFLQYLTVEPSPQSIYTDFRSAAGERC